MELHVSTDSLPSGKLLFFHKVLEIDFLLGTGAGGRGGGLSDFCWVTIIYLIPQEAPR